MGTLLQIYLWAEFSNTLSTFEDIDKKLLFYTLAMEILDYKFTIFGSIIGDRMVITDMIPVWIAFCYPPQIPQTNFQKSQVFSPIVHYWFVRWTQLVIIDRKRTFFISQHLYAFPKSILRPNIRFLFAFGIDNNLYSERLLCNMQLIRVDS